jgi:serine/threonine-protein kinase
MAVVFLAEDLRHHRRVALKVLHPELTATLGAERFLHEIETIASLNHPHILPLHDSGEADGLLYFVMPYAEGESLRQRLDREKQLAVDESVRIAVEVADGLDYAHQKGVVHRDIKPGNILLSARHAVIADFGIARAIEVARADRVTSTGLGVGTPLYASPEQATAQETLDGRTDIYSLGCVLYEMLAGEPPLTGSTPQMIQARRLSETPTALHALRDTVPPALDHVIARSLARIPADRYATASQFGQALQAVLFAATPADLSATPGELPTTPAAVAPEPKKKVPRWVLFAVPTLGISVVIAGVMLGLSSAWLGRGPLQITISNIRSLTSDPGLEFQPAISPDGSEVAYVEGPIGNPRIVVRSAIDVGRGGETYPGEEASGLHWLPAWTPDGASLSFFACQLRVPGELGSDCGWKEVGSRGGPVRSAGVPRASSRYAWSRDGTRVAFSVRDSIFAFSTDNPEPELLGVHTVDTWQPHSLAWSPDGRWIAYVNGNPWWRNSANVFRASIWILDGNGGEPVRVTDEEHMSVSPQWLPDSGHLLFVSNRDGPRGVYVVEVGSDGPRGLPRSLLPSSDPHSISISADGRRLAYSKFTATQNIWSIPIPRSGSVSIRDAVPVTEGNQVIETHALSPDSEWIAFESDIGGGFDIYKMPLEGGPSQLVADITGNAFTPDWSPDGNEIAFFSPVEVFVVSADGGAPRQLTDFPGRDVAPDWSPDGLAIAYLSDGPRGEGPYKVWMVSRDSVGLPWSDPVQLTDFRCSDPDWAPDGASLVCDTEEDELARVSRDGEVLSRYDPWTAGQQVLGTFRFSPDGSRIYFLGAHEDGSRGVWWIPANGGDATQVVAFDDPSVAVLEGFLTVGPENLYLTVAEYESDIWVMDLDW